MTLESNVKITHTVNLPTAWSANYMYSFIFSSPELKAQGELIVWDSSRRPSTLSNMNISETSRPIVIKFHHEQYWGGGLTG